MTFGDSFKTERGTGYYIGDLTIYSYFVHINKEKLKSVFHGKLNNIEYKEIDILFSKRGEKSVFSYLPLNEIVEHGDNEGEIKLTPEESRIIDETSWDFLIKELNIFPTKFITIKPRKY